MNALKIGLLVLSFSWISGLLAQDKALPFAGDIASFKKEDSVRFPAPGPGSFYWQFFFHQVDGYTSCIWATRHS